MPNIILATGGFDHTIKLWEVSNKSCYRTLQFSESQVNKLELTPNRKYLAAAGNPHIKLYELTSNNPNPVSNFSSHKTNVTAIGFEKQGDFLYSGSEDGTIKIWDPRLPNFQKEFVYTEACNTVELHPNQNDFIAGHQNGVLCVYDLCAGKKRMQFTPEEDTSVKSLSISKDGNYCCAALNNGKCYVWNLSPETAEYFNDEKCWQAHNAYVLKVLYSPNMSTLATTSSDGTICIWKTKDYSLYNVLKSHTRWVWDCVYSYNSEYLATASSDNLAYLWDINEEKPIAQFSGHHKAVTCITLTDIKHPSKLQNIALAQKKLSDKETAEKEQPTSSTTKRSMP
ncbi:uncharacterized protein LOC126315249 [Schistocerca gregaria]|uniref:uncharacterized protein LOC126315249 n=1 Tax=Schistocerca gregaria TaxID=7010 RepID=UPI00211DB393|nr:uncharacterized protein LOC126315249 [Schistocerca gregaria]